MKFPKGDLLDLLDGDGFDDYRFLDIIYIGSSRWSNHHELIFGYKDKYYGVTYSQGATENQDEYPFDYEPDEIECYEVEPVEKTTIVYEKKN